MTARQNCRFDRSLGRHHANASLSVMRLGIPLKRDIFGPNLDLLFGGCDLTNFGDRIYATIRIQTYVQFLALWCGIAGDHRFLKRFQDCQ